MCYQNDESTRGRINNEWVAPIDGTGQEWVALIQEISQEWVSLIGESFDKVERVSLFL